jgi:uncharacterized phage protein (TIGR02216 family)
MTAQRGKDLLLKVDTTGSGAFATVAGLRARSLAFNAATVDITHAESTDQWRELLAGLCRYRRAAAGGHLRPSRGRKRSLQAGKVAGGRAQAFPWDEVIAAGLGRLRLRPADFWAMTPRELSLALKGAGGLPIGAPGGFARSDLDALMQKFPD